MTAEFMDECALHEPAPAAFISHTYAYSRVDVSSYVMTGYSPAWLMSAKAQLVELSRLQRGWDSYNAEPISTVASKAAMGLLRQLSGPDTPRPDLVPTVDGSVQIEWHTHGIDLEVQILSSTRMRVCIEDARGQLDPLEDELQYDLRTLSEAVQVLSSR
jgi:hypothetical protein